MITPSSQLARIDDLTRRYARFSRNQAGLGTVWAGVCLGLLAAAILALDLLQYSQRPAAAEAQGFWRFLLASGSTPQAPWLLGAAFGLPVVWLLGRTLIQRGIYERDGTVIGQETETESTCRTIMGVLEILVPCTLIPAQWILPSLHGFPASEIPGTLAANVLLLAVPLVGRRLASSLDRTAWLMLLFGCSDVAAGGYAESLLVSLFGYAALGLVLAGHGLHSHREFLRVKRDLDALAPASSPHAPGAPADQPSGALPR